MVSSRTTIAINSRILGAFDHLGTAKKTDRLVTNPLHLGPDITAWLSRARHTDGNRCDVSRDARAEQRFCCVIISFTLF